jgi:sulfatase maturation enzyme AslB (radical SAM superfamily)
MTPQTCAHAPDPVQPEGVDEGIFASILQRVMAAETTYVRLNRLTESDPDYQDPETFCRALLEDTLPERCLAGPERDRFFAWAEAQRPRARLLPVLASQDHLDRGDKRAARRYAQRALSVNRTDLYAQRLYRFSQPGPVREQELRGRFCDNPFDKAEIRMGGEVYLCCPEWLPVPIGNLERQSAAEIWNSPAAQDVRQSIFDGSFRYCSRMNCGKLSSYSLPRTDQVTNQEHREFIGKELTKLPRGPKRLVLNHDISCNLSCPSCRTRLIVARKDEQTRLDAMADRVLMPLVQDARKIQLTGGDPFGSAHYRHLLKRIGEVRPAQLKVDLQTNGLLLAQSWDNLGLDGLVDIVYISIDATRPETYAIVRRGGDFARLLDNLEFVAAKRREGQIRRVRLDWVVQTLNFREIPEAVDLVRRFGFDGLKLQMIRNWGTYTPEEFAWHHIGSPDHPLFAEFLEVLRDPRLQAGFVEFWGFYSVDFERLGMRPAPGAVRSGDNAGA